MTIFDTDSAAPLASTKNWPPFYPLLTHDINHDLPVSTQSLATKSLHLWYRKFRGMNLKYF